MSYIIAHQFPGDLFFEAEGPFVSIYQPTHRYFPDNKQDTIVYKNLLRKIDHSLNLHDDKIFTDTIMKPLYQLEDDKNFWNNTLDGIAVLAAKNKCIIYHLRGPVKEFAVVANSFHIKPLVQAFQSVESYQLLGLSRTSCSIYQGNRYGFSEITTDPNFPSAMEDILRDQYSEPYAGQGSFGGISETAVSHGQGDKKERDDKDTEKYFRNVDRFVLENYSKPSKMPLILVALKEYHSLFGGLSHNPYLLEEGINISYDALEMEEINSKALELLRPINEERTRKLTESYENAEAESFGSSDLAQVVKAAYESRIETLLMDENRIEPGKIDDKTGKINLCDIQTPDCDDILDDLAELVLKNRGAVWVLPKDNVPGLSGVAAIYRYK